MKKPVPIAEIIVKRLNGLDRILYITVVTEDARNWVTTEAPQFGSVYMEFPNNPDSRLMLFVSDAYKPDEVAHYLEQGYAA